MSLSGHKKNHPVHTPSPRNWLERTCGKTQTKKNITKAQRGISTQNNPDDNDISSDSFKQPRNILQ